TLAEIVFLLHIAAPLGESRGGLISAEPARRATYTPLQECGPGNPYQWSPSALRPRPRREQISPSRLRAQPPHRRTEHCVCGDSLSPSPDPTQPSLCAQLYTTTAASRGAGLLADDRARGLSRMTGH